MSKVFFTADLHLGHSNIIGRCNRPFASTAEMNEALVSNWNSRVRHTDTVWVLGDVSFYPPNRTDEILSQLRGFKKLVLGNHDKMLKKKAGLLGHFTEVHAGLHELYLQDEESAGAHFAVLCHYPLLSWNRAFHGSIHLHGHTHSRVPVSSGARRYDVGVDANAYAPVSLREVLDALRENAVHDANR